MMLWFSIPKERLRVEFVPRSVTAFRLALAACLLLPLLAHAAGLGRLTVQSAIGQPLRAEVAVVSLQAGEADALTARIASPEAFRLAGIEFNSALLSVQVAVERRDGKPVLSLTSTQPINEPFVELLIELQWATGRLVREYTFLLDPTEYKAPQPVAAAPAPPAPVIAKPEPVPVPAAPAVETKPLGAQAAGTGTYQVKKGDTLSKVARENKPDGVSVNQMLVALYQSNQSAFIRKNMYLMRSGHVLKIPERAAVASISPAEATRMVRAQQVGFDEYRRNLGASVAARPAKPAAPVERAVPGRITPKAAEPSPRDTKDQIKLSKLDSAKAAAPASRAAAEDDKASLNRALKESQSRVADLEKQLTDLKKLVEMKNQQLALLEKKAAVAPAVEAPKPVPPAPKPAPEPVKPVAEAPKPAAPAPVAEAAKPKPVAPPAPKPATEPVKAKAAAAPPPPSLVDEFIENPLALGGLGGVVVLLAGYGAWAWRRKKSAQSRGGGFSAVAADSAAAEAARAAPAPDKSAAEAALAQVQAAAATAAADEVDPIAEADVYLAYGRDAQAETILKDALASDPNRLVVHAKLLDIYAQRRDSASFEKTAVKVKSLSGGSGPEWQKARALGRSIDPENGLYGTRSAEGDETPAQPASASPTVDFDLGGGSASAPAPAPAPDSVDFDIGASTAETQAPPQFKPGDTVVLSAADMQAAGSGMNFDIGAATQETPAAKPAPAPEEAPSSLDFNLDFDLGETKPAPAAAPAPDISSISLDLGAPGEAQPAAGAKWQEVATKLDLAKAYEEMGDKDGARELLNEVLTEGDAAQQEEAKRMLAKLG